VRFHTTIKQSGKTATGIQIPEDVVEALGKGKRPPVRVTINGFTYRSTIAVRRGVYMVGVSAENRAGAGVGGGDEVEVEIELDTEPREVVVPSDLAAALACDADAARFFESLSYSQKLWFVVQVTDAKTAETRKRRIGRALELLRDGRSR
jgi:hypothetical protein